MIDKDVEQQLVRDAGSEMRAEIDKMLFSDTETQKDLQALRELATLYEIPFEEHTGNKESDGKVSYQEVDPQFITLMAKRLSSNKSKYPKFNWKKPLDYFEILDAMERHVVDLKQLLLGLQPIHNQEESIQDHLAAIAVNSQIINYQIGYVE